ncbi:unnamed protein product [Victoria cruziana]
MVHSLGNLPPLTELTENNQLVVPVA